MVSDVEFFFSYLVDNLDTIIFSNFLYAYAPLGPDDTDSFLTELSGFLRECRKLSCNLII